VLLAAYLAIGLAACGATYSYKNYMAGSMAVLPSVKAMAPIEPGIALRAVVPHIASEQREGVSGVLRSRLEEAALFHREWVKHLELRQELLRNQLILWLVTLAALFGVLVGLYLPRGRNAP
jgi:hypothetical protein